MSRTITITVFSSVTDQSTGTRHRIAWDSFSETPPFAEHAVFGDARVFTPESIEAWKTNFPLFVFGETHGRKAGQIVHMDGLCVDIDDASEEQQEAALDALRNYNYFAYTTFKSGADIPKVQGKRRLRLVIPYETRLEAQDPGANWLKSRHKKIFAHVNDLIGGIADPQTKDINRLSYVPSTFDPSLAWSTQNAAGAFFDWTALDFRSPSRIKSHAQKSPSTPLDASNPATLRKWFNAPTGLLREPSDEMAPSAIIEAAKRVAAGEPYADEGSGQRHNLMRRLTWCLAYKYPDAPPSSVEELFEPSIAAMEETHEDPPPTLDAVVQAFEDALAKVADHKLEVAREKQLEKERTKKHIEETHELNNSAEKYTEADLKELAKFAGCKVAELERRWIVCKESAMFILTLDGYKGPFKGLAAVGAASEYLQRAPVLLYKIVNDAPVAKSMSELMLSNGTFVDDMTYVMNDDQTRIVDYSGSRVLEVSAYGQIKHEPEEHPEVDEWLRLLAGDEWSEKLLDWVSCVPDLSKPICALYMVGSSGAGKTLFAHGLASLWSPSSTPANARFVFGTSFQGAILDSPIVFADEEMPKIDRRQSSSISLIREYIGSRSMQINLKGLPETKIKGCTRLIMAANNRNMLRATGATTKDDIDAVSRRVLKLEPGVKARAFLLGMSSKERDAFRTRKLAEHALHLAVTRDIPDTFDTLVVAAEGQSKAYLLGSGKINRETLEWLARYLMDPGKCEDMLRATGHLKRKDGGLFVTADALYTHWQVYVKSSRETPERSAIQEALQVVSRSKKRAIYHGGVRTYYHEIDLDTLFQYVRDNDLGEESQMRRALLAPADRRSAISEEVKKDERRNA